MTFLYALDLHEILSLIAEFLDRRDIRSCTKVSKTWYNFFLPFLWRQVVVTQTGPNFSHAHQLIHRIQRLDLRSSPVQSSVPTQGFSHLTALKISGLDHREHNHNNNWPQLTSILLNLGPTNTLQSFDLCDSSASPDFWTALSQCPRLASLTLTRSTVPAPAFSAFWDTCAALEAIHVESVEICSGGMPLPKLPRRNNSGAFLRLKHLTHTYVHLCPKRSEHQDQDHDQAQDVEDPVIFPWTFAPHLETLCLVDWSHRSAPTFSLSHMVEDIRLAQEAAAAGRHYYFKHSNGLIPFSNLHTLAIHSQRCRDRYIAFLIDTIDILHRITLEFSGPALQTFCALGRHKRHLTEVDVRFCDVDSVQVLTLLASCEKLEVLAATEIRVQDVVYCRKPWVCLGLKKLRVDIVVDTASSSSSSSSSSSGAEITNAAQAVFGCIGQLVQLESLDISGGMMSDQQWQMHLKVDIGLGRLQGLKELRHLRARGSMFDEMSVADAEWMVHHWPQLETFQICNTDAYLASSVVGMVFVLAGVW
ncbi:hypothetical protein BGZ82_005654 [Podila clonocystis]|nr:hypothetical protein BGZ82_005654 [Podila clonocystis]